jgi:large subunit ribosomal protein L18
MDARKQRFQRRRDRVRYKVREHGRGRPRLSVHRSNEHIYAQIIDDGKGVTEVVFDRGGFIFHGRVKALADGAREAGLKF